MFFRKTTEQKEKIKHEKLAAFFKQNAVSYKPTNYRKHKSFLYGSTGEHFLQEKYGTQNQAKEFYSREVIKSLAPTMQQFIARQAFLFISTSNKQGQSECHFIQGGEGFIQALSEKYLIFPIYQDQNIVHLMNNIIDNPHSALLIPDFFHDKISIHVNGKASIIQTNQLLQFKDYLSTDMLAKANDTSILFWLMLAVEEVYKKNSRYLPLLQKLDKSAVVLQTEEDNKPVLSLSFWASLKSNKLLFVYSLLVLFFSVALLLLPAIPPASSVQTFNLSVLWHDNLYQQITGYSILFLVIIGLFMSLHKRIPVLRFWRYAWWRLFHVFTSLLAIIILIFHTGLSLGSHYNLMLILYFITTLVVGSIIAILTSLEKYHIKNYFLSVHIALVWFLPVLVAIHILSVYYF